MVSWYKDDSDFPKYKSVGAKQSKAVLAAKKLTAKGAELTPAVVKGTKLATTFWGQAWNRNLERYQHYENRLPRGRSYVRNGMVIHLQIEKGLIKALVSGTYLYEVHIYIQPLRVTRWKSLKSECAGQISSLVSLLQGKIPPAIMELVTDPHDGLFPEPRDIRFSCSCPDDADLCKHSSAALYGVGARLDEHPELLFLLRGADHTELISDASEAIATEASSNGDAHSLGDLSDIFGIELEGQPTPLAETEAPKPPSKKSVTAKKKASATAKKSSKRK